jgi:hypothetical protein
MSTNVDVMQGRNFFVHNQRKWIKSIDFEHSQVVVIYGKKEFGKKNLLRLLMNGLCAIRSDARVVFLDDGRNQLKPIYESINTHVDSVMINQYEQVELCFNDDTKKSKKLSPFQQFYVYLNENYITIDKRFLAGIYGVSKELSKEFGKIPDYSLEQQPFTVFVIQSKLVYLNANENKFFMNALLPQLAAVAEERGYLFLFTDVQKINDSEQNSYFNNALFSAFLLDNIAEFAGERGQKTIFGSMDVKALKEDYARCEKGDGYYYDVEADRLMKLKVIKTSKPNQRFTFDTETNTVHRFYNDGNGVWHWSGSTNQGANSLTGIQVPNDIKNILNLPKKGW